MEHYRRGLILTVYIILFYCDPLFAQFSDSLKITLGSTATLATKDYQPLWIESLQSGTIARQKADLSTHVWITNIHVLYKKGQRHEKIKDPESKEFYLSYGIDLYNNNHFKGVFTKEAYVKAGYKAWEIRAGQFAETIGEVDLELSSGSFAVSGNALPIPKIGLALTDYMDVPFTKGFLQFKGQFSHGWLGETNFVKEAFLHEKSLYVKGGKRAFSLYGGLSHFANWAGTHPNGQAPSRLKDYLRIIAGASGDAEDPVYHHGPVDIANAVGNHMIISDMGMGIKLSKSVLKLYTQTIFEKGKGDSSNTSKRDELIALNVFGKDRLIGISWETKKPAFLEKVLIEGIYTKDQGGPIIFNGRFNYYNNATYATGWEYKDHIIGTPLFVNRRLATEYDLDQSSTTGWNVVSNRVVGVHAGLKGSVNKMIGYRTLLTYIRHYGNYYNDALFDPPKRQGNLLFEITCRLNSRTFLTPTFGLDHGDISRNMAGKLTVEWRIR